MSRPFLLESAPEMRYERRGADLVKKRKKEQFTASTEARRRARASGLRPAGTRVIEDKRKRSAKHKKRLLDESLE